MTVRNLGGDGGPATVPVTMRIGDGDPESVHELDRPPSGEVVSIVVRRGLALGQHTVSFSIQGVEQTVDVHLKAADIAVRPVSHAVVGDGSIELILMVSNQGDFPAHSISVVANWKEDEPDREGDPKPKQALGIIDSLEPKQSRTLYLPIEVQTGIYTLEFNVETETLEVELGNNTAEAIVEVDFVTLLPSIESKEIVGYEPDGQGIVRSRAARA